MTYTKPASLKLLQSIFKDVTGLEIWRPYYLSNVRKYDPQARAALKKSNTKVMIKYIREWLDKCEKTL